MSEEMSKAAMQSESEVTTRVGHTTFGNAVAALKMGKRVQRAGWNGKGMYVYLKHGFREVVPGDQPDYVDGVPELLFGHGPLGTVTRLPTLCLKTASGSVLEGWLASQTDVLAEDWAILAD